MDDLDRSATVSPPGLEPAQGDLPPDFVPLRWLLQPNGLCLTFSRTDMVVGRHSEADVRLHLPDVSRRHCRVVFEDSQWLIIDLNSLNGVYVNGEKVQESVLRDGDHVRLASLNFVVALEGPASGMVRRILDLLSEPEDTLKQRRKAS